jgi:predicted RNA-binding protein (TIGR00451 family)
LKRQVASKHDSREYIERVQSSSGLNLDVSRSSQVEIIEPQPGLRFLVIDGKHTFLEKEGSLIPYVGSQGTLALLPSAYIDDGAIKYILKGADVMRPGIVKYDEWGPKDVLVVVRDEKKGRGLAIGRANVASAEMGSLSKGISIKNLHHAGDAFWDSYKLI